MDPNACNFDENAAIEDQSCLYTVDCNGDCGGMAVLTNECGCVGGLTGVDANSCLGMCQGEICLSTYPSDPDGFANTSGLAFSQSGQTFTAVSSSFLTGTRVRNAVALTGSALTVELRRLDAPDIHNGTLLAVTSQANFTESPGQGFDIFLEWSSPVLLESGSEYALVFIGADWFILRAESSLILNGASFEADESTASQHDLFFELMCCDEVAGCAMPTACNFDAWATLDNGSCLFPLPGQTCTDDACESDADGDGICAQIDQDDNDPTVCFDGDGDGCDDCSSGTYDPLSDGPDSDGDGICDLSDMCSNPLAINYADESNGPCIGECDNAPLFYGLAVTDPATDPWSEDGFFEVSYGEAGFAFALSSGFAATTLQLTGQGNSPDYTIDLTESLPGIRPGWYIGTLLNAEGCPGVATAVHGSTFGQVPVHIPLIMTYALCCGGDCGNSDVDNDMICDDEDQCTDREALNYADPANGPCEY